MKTNVVAWVVGGILAVGTAGVAGGADNWEGRGRGGPPPPRIVLFERPNFRGAALELEPGAMISDLSTLRFPNGARVNDNVSSIVVGRGLAVRFYVDDEYRGEFLEMARDIDDLAALARGRNEHWSDAISSLRVVEARPGAGRERDPSRRPRVIVFRNDNFRGEAFEIFPGEDLGDLNRERFESGADLNKEIASIRIVGPLRVRLYVDTRFRGESIELTSDAVDLSHVRRANGRRGWKNQAASIKVEWIDPNHRDGGDDDDDRGRGGPGGNDRDRGRGNGGN